MMDDGWSVDKWLELAGTYKVTFAVPVASQVRQIVTTRPVLPYMRLIVSSSATLDRTALGGATTDGMREVPIVDCYGTTEVSVATDTLHRSAKGSVGKAWPGVGVTISQDGEITVATPLMFDGYYGCQALTEASFSNGYFRTGDLGSLDDAGNLVYLGRIKELINVGGTKVYPQDVEAVFRDYTAIVECAAFPQVDEALGEVVALAIVLEEVQLASLFDWTREVQKLCLPYLTDEQLPRAVYVMTAPLPRTETGKLQRGKIAEMVGADK